MSRYEDYALNVHPIEGLLYSRDIPPLREYPLACDPRRQRSYKKVQDIERSRDDQPLLELPITDPYHLRRVVVPSTRSQFAPPGRIPNARDPRGARASNRVSDARRRAPWVPTLVENDRVPQEEETCAVLTIDASEWESARAKSCYIEVVPHECNVQRALEDARQQLAALDDGLLMSPEEAERRMRPEPPATTLDDSDVQECDSEGEAVPREPPPPPEPAAPVATGFDSVEDRPMLEVGEGGSPGEGSRDGRAASPPPRRRRVDEDEDEDRVIYLPDEEPEAPPRPRPDDAEVECVELEADEAVVVPKKEPPSRPRSDDAEVQFVDLDADEVVVVPNKEPQAPSPRPRANDADVQFVDLDVEEVVVPKKEPQAQPQPRADDANVMCIDLDDDDDDDDGQPPSPRPDDANVVGFDDLDLNADEEEVILPKQEPQDAYAPFARNVQREVLEVVTLDDSDELEDESREDLSFPDDSRVSKEPSERDRPKSNDGYSAPTCSSATSLPPAASEKDSLESPLCVRAGEKSSEDEERVGRATEQQTLKSRIRDSDCDCDSEPALGSDLGTDILESVIRRFRAAENDTSDAKAREQSAARSVGFGAAVPDSLDSADRAGRSGDSDSGGGNNVPTTTITQIETVAEVHVPATCERDDDLIARAEIRDARSASEETARLASACATTKRRKRRRKKRKRLDSATDATGNADDDAVIAETKRRRENDDVAVVVVVNDENKNDNTLVVVERVPSPVFTTLPRKRKRPTRKPSDNALQLSRTSTCAIAKPSPSVRRTISFGNFYALGILKEYLKNYTATYSSVQFFCKSFESLSVFEFLRVNELVKNNIAFWQNRNNHWHQKESNVCIEDVTDNRTFNQLAITESSSTLENNQVACLHEVAQPGESPKTVIESGSTTWSQQSFSIDKDTISFTKSTWLAQGNDEKDADGKLKLQRRHSLPMVIVPQQNLGAKRPRSGSDDNSIKITLRRSQGNDNAWIATGGPDAMQTISAQCTLLPILNSNIQNQIDCFANKDVVSGSQSLTTNNACTLNRKRLPKWSCIDKEVPELDIDDFVNRPLPQKIQFDESKLSISLQSRVKKRSTSIDSAIVSDLDDSACKRRKLTDSTKEHEMSIDIFNDYDDRLSFEVYTRNPREIRELSPDSCIDSRPASANICNLNNNNYKGTCENLDHQKSCNSEDLPKICSTNIVTISEKDLNRDENNSPCLEDVNNYLHHDTSSSDSDSSFHLQVEDEHENQSSTVESRDPNIQIDYNCNLQKDSTSLDEPSHEISNTRQDESNLIDNSGKQKNSESSKLFIKKIDQLSECNIDKVNKIVTLKYNCNIYQSEIMSGQKDIPISNPIESTSQSIDEKQSIDDAVERSVKSPQDPALNSIESGSINTITNNNEPEQLICDEKDSNIEATLGKNTHNENHLNDLKLALSSSENENEMITSGSSVAPVQSDSSKNVDQDENYSDVLNDLELALASSESEDETITSRSSVVPIQNDSSKNVDQVGNHSDVLNSQALIINEKQNQIEFTNTLESETSLCANNQPSAILNEEVDSNVSHCNVNDNVTSEEVFQDQSNEHVLDDTMNVANCTNAEHSPSKDAKVLECDRHRDNDEDLLDNQGDDKDLLDNQEDDKDLLDNQEEASSTSTSSSSLDHDQVLPETIGLEDGLEEGDFDFLSSIQGSKTNPESDDDDYDINSDCEEYENRTMMEYSSDVNVHKINESFISNENIDINNYQTNISGQDNHSSKIEAKRVSTICKDKHLSSLQKSPTKITNFDSAKSNSNNVEEDDDIIIEYENINDSSLSKDVKPDILNINHDLNVQVSEVSGLHAPNSEIPEDTSLDIQSEVPTIVTPTLLPQSSTNENDSTVEQEQSQPKSTTENINFSDKSRVEIPVPDTNLDDPIPNNSLATSAIETSSNGSNDKVSDANISENPILASELRVQSSKNVNIDFNSSNILQQFNLTREIIAPEDIKAESSATFESNDEEQTFNNTLKQMLEDKPGEECSVPTLTDEQNHSNKNVEAPLPSTIVHKFQLPTMEAQSGNNYELFKSLNINVDNQVDIITEEAMDRNPAKHGSPGVIKVKNLNDMLKKPQTASVENVSSNQDVSSGNPLPSVAENSQQNINYGAENPQSQSNWPANMYATNNSVPSAYIIQPQSYAYIVNQPIPAHPIQPLMNMCNILPVPVPIMTNVGQHVQFPNAALLNQAPIQNNVQISAPAAPDKQIVLASSMFPGMFDSNATSSFCSKTVFNMQLPPLQNIILPPPYTLLPTYDQLVIGEKIREYKWALLDKLIMTLTELENMDVNILKRHIDVLYCRLALTPETWNIQEKILIVAQCVGSLQKLTTDKNYSNIIEAIMGSIYSRVRDHNLLKKIFGIFQKLKEQGIFKHFATEEQPLTLELGSLLNQPATGMSSGHKEILKYHIKIYQEILRVNERHLQSNRVSQSNNQKMQQAGIQRSSPMAIQQNIVTTTVSSPVTDTANSSLQNLVNTQCLGSVSTGNSTNTMQQQCGREKQCHTIQQSSEGFANKCDNVSKPCIKCGKKSQILCSRCKIATYCSQNCQNEHWKVEHHAHCNSLK